MMIKFTFQILFLSIQRNAKLKPGDHNIRKQGRRYKRSIQKFWLQLVFAIVSVHLSELIIFFLAGIVVDDITVKDVFSLRYSMCSTLIGAISSSFPPFGEIFVFSG